MSQILLIESDRLLAKHLSRVLKRRGYRINWQVELQAAIDSTDRQAPDLIILDLLLAGRSGAEFLYELRSYPEWRDLPVVLLSQVGQSELSASMASLEDLNITSFLYKPQTHLDDVVDVVDRVLAAAPAKV